MAHFTDPCDDVLDRLAYGDEPGEFDDLDVRVIAEALRARTTDADQVLDWLLTDVIEAAEGGKASAVDMVERLRGLVKMHAIAAKAAA